MLWFVLFLLIVLGLLAAFIVDVSQRRKNLTAALNSLHDFKVTASYIDDQAQTAIASDEVNKKIALLRYYDSGIRSRVLSRQELLAVEVIADSREPVHRITFLEGEHRADSSSCRRALEKARHWEDLLKGLMAGGGEI